MLRPLAKAILRAAARLPFRARTEGNPRALDAERLPIIANHESFLDGLLRGLFCVTLTSLADHA